MHRCVIFDATILNITIRAHNSSIGLPIIKTIINKCTINMQLINPSDKFHIQTHSIIILNSHKLCSIYTQFPLNFHQFINKLSLKSYWYYYWAYYPLESHRLIHSSIYEQYEFIMAFPKKHRPPVSIECIQGDMTKLWPQKAQFSEFDACLSCYGPNIHIRTKESPLRHPHPHPPPLYHPCTIWSQI